jgi:hypothetical protein
VIVVAKYLFFSWDSSMSDLWWRRGWWPPSRWSILSNTAHYKKELLTLVTPAIVPADGTIILQSTLLHKNLFKREYVYITRNNRRQKFVIMWMVSFVIFYSGNIANF